jgi:hypothetical protein
MFSALTVHRGPVIYALGMPPLLEKSFSLGASSGLEDFSLFFLSICSCFILLMDPKAVEIDGRSLMGFRVPKKALGVADRDIDAWRDLTDGLVDAIVAVPGLNEGAAALGRNSIALTLNFADIVEVGV